jgi:mannosyltransferase OCH1-like enzyme
MRIARHQSEWQNPRIIAAIIVFVILCLLYQKNGSSEFSTPRPYHSSSPPQTTYNNINMKIPKLLHQCAMEPPDHQKQDSTRISPLWMESCLQHYLQAGWQHMIWKNENSLQFIKDKAPWFYETYKNYPTITHRCDALRYVLLYHLGGMYIDTVSAFYTIISNTPPYTYFKTKFKSPDHYCVCIGY